MKTANAAADPAVRERVAKVVEEAQARGENPRLLLSAMLEAALQFELLQRASLKDVVGRLPASQGSPAQSPDSDTAAQVAEAWLAARATIAELQRSMEQLDEERRS